MIYRTYHPVRREPKKLTTAHLSVPMAMCNAKMLPGGVRKIEDDLPKQVAGRSPWRGKNSGHGTDRYSAAPEEY